MLSYSIPRVVISALRGSSGKTIFSLSLVALWHKKGLKVTPFKKGPDYIDAGWLAKATGSPCFNLDLFMMMPRVIVQSFISHTYKTQIALIEGNRGLYDGVDSEGTYSTAELAKLLNAPVILVVDCTKATNTVSAMVLGCQRLDPEVSIAGVVLNNVANGRQETLIRKSIVKNCNLPVLGAIPRLKKDPFPERHMGLTPFQEHREVDKSIPTIAEMGSKYLDLEAIWRIANEAEPLKVSSELENPPSPPFTKGGRGGLIKSLLLTRHSSLKIGVIKDSAFQFYYPENFEELEKRGAKIVEISALREKELPDIDALYIGGGFPETHAIALAENVDFRNSLRKAVEEGLPVYAECGGLMYLGESLVLEDKTYPMSGVFPIVFGLGKKPEAHGYSIIEVERPNPYYSEGITLRGHEFHYSRALRIGEKAGVYMAFKVRRGQGIKDRMDGICYRNALATYTHLHALGAEEWADGMLRCAMRFKKHYTHNP